MNICSIQSMIEPLSRTSKAKYRNVLDDRESERESGLFFSLANYDNVMVY